MQSLEELALLNCFPPDVLEKYFLKIIDKLNDKFVSSNYKKITDALEKKSKLFKMAVANRMLHKLVIFKNLKAEDVSNIFIYILSKLSGGELSYFTIRTLFDCTYNLPDGSFDTTDLTADNIVRDFKDMLLDNTKTSRLTNQGGFSFSKGTWALRIDIFETQDELDDFFWHQSFLQHQYSIRFDEDGDDHEYILSEWCKN